MLQSTTPEPHATRRQRILAAHPEISRLAGPEWKSKYIALGLVATQLGVAVASRGLSWPHYLFCMYFVGATLAQSLFLAVHELSHNLFFRSPRANRLCSIGVNLPIVVPFAIAFRSHHLAHHANQGSKVHDPDLPSEREVRWVKGRVAKAAWLTFQIAFYALRPTLTRRTPVTRELFLNWLVQLLFDAFVVLHFGWAPLRFLLVSVVVAGGPHPCAGHFLSEHHVPSGGTGDQETFSYYGSLNALTWNVGYHNEHHDFPHVAWSSLPAVSRAAPEYYATLLTCPSWCASLWTYVFDDSMGPWRRVMRE